MSMSMPTPMARIAAVATASPSTRFTQDEVLAVFGYDDPQRRGFFERSDIEGRYMYVDRDHARADESVDDLHARFQAGALELGETAIPNRYKELIGLAVAAHLKCRYCIYFHTRAAQAFGATDEQLREACAMGGLTVLYSNAITGMQIDLERFKQEVDRAIEYVTEHAAAPAPH